MITDKMFHRNIYVFLLSYLAFSHSLRHEYEPRCSKFHYEEQLLEKMIRLEIKFETLLDNVEKLETSIKEERRIMNEERAAERQELQKWLADKNETVVSFVTASEQKMEDWIADKDESITSLVKDTRDAFEDNERKLARMSADLTEFQNKTLGNVTSMIDSLKHRTVAFEAHKISKLNPSQGEKIVFTDTKLNDGDGYDNTTGVFTAPEDGTYLIFVQFCLQYDKGIYFYIMKDGEIASSSVFTKVNKVNYACYSTQTIVKAVKANNIWIEANRDHASYTLYDDSPWVNTFSGILIN